MLPTRAGELLLGAISAVAVLRQIEKRIYPFLIGPLAYTGLLLITGSLIFLTDEHVFPGVLAIPSTLGTGMLILAGHCRNNSVSKILSMKGPVGIGLVSYSAYLWHWPILAFLNYGGIEIGVLQGSLAIVTTFVLAWISFVFIEKPARASRDSAIRIFTKQYVIPAGALAIVALAAMYADGYGLH
jgi:peptidoglycan/LPS O-acetylase OafA/YrhL